MASIWPNVKVGMLIAMVYAVYGLIQGVRTLKSILATGLRSQSET